MTQHISVRMPPGVKEVDVPITPISKGAISGALPDEPVSAKATFDTVTGLFTGMRVTRLNADTALEFDLEIISA